MKVNDLPNDELVNVFITLRDKRLAMKATYENAAAELKAKQEKIQSILLTRFNASGTESMRTKYGTAYKQKQTFATVGDKDTFLAYVKEHDAFELMETRCSKTGVDQFIAANKDVPPGVNYSEAVVVNIRRGA